jgi:hypothetical protein
MFVNSLGRMLNLRIKVLVNKPNRRDREVWEGTAH